MNNSLYMKLAATNIKKNAKIYVPYILTCIFTIAMYYVIFELSQNSGLNEMPGSATVVSMLKFGVVIMGILSGIFIFYTNSFLIKQRKKEFGLFNILGMEKRHISKMLLFENIYVSLGSLASGVLLGMLLNKLMFLLLLKILHFEVKMGIEFSMDAILGTIALFLVIFLLVLLNTMRQIYFSKPIELIKGGNRGEREPKNKWIITIIGLVSLGIGYYLSVTTTNPLAVINTFFVAVIFVCIGTYCLFTAGSITLLKLLRKNKNYYYKTNHFISLSTMMYRMKQNAVGLANICILSTAVLVMLSSTVSLYIGSEDIIRTRYPRNIALSGKNSSDESINIIKNTVDKVLIKNNLNMKNLQDYKAKGVLITVDGNNFIENSWSNPSTMVNDANMLIAITLDDYNRLMNESKTLNDDEVLMYSNRKEYSGDIFLLDNINFKIKEKVEECVVNGKDAANIFNTHYIIVKDEIVFNKILKDVDSECYYGFDLEDNSGYGVKVYNDLLSEFSRVNNTGEISVEASQVDKPSFYSIYGGFFFLGIFLGALFIMATILIMYYKQISEGYDDKERYNIMQKVGMNREEIKSTINSQVLTVFFMPLLFAIVNIAFAFPSITRLLSALNFTNASLYGIYTGVTILAFALCYGVMYFITAKLYYKIVK